MCYNVRLLTTLCCLITMINFICFNIDFRRLKMVFWDIRGVWFMKKLASLVGFFKKSMWAKFKVHDNHELPIQVTKEQLSAMEDWPPSVDSAELMFATKNGLPIAHFPITHSAIGLVNLDKGIFTIYGRQSPFDVSMWPRHGFEIRTRKDNERSYLNPQFGFTLYPTGVFFPKSEINHFLNSADKTINQAQSCNMINSNCYSYSISVMISALECLTLRPMFDCNAVLRIIDVMKKHPLSNHGSFGVLNNQTVVNSLLSVLQSIKKLAIALSEESIEAKELAKVTKELIDQVETESKKYRIISIFT